jgi:tetratricopeptide (TPR) repeat protein
MIKHLFRQRKPIEQNAPACTADFNREHATILKNGKHSLDEGKYDEAMEVLKEAERLCRERGDKVNLAASCDMQSAALRKLGMPNEALRNLWASERIYSEKGDKPALAACFAAQAFIHYDLGNRHFAAGLLKREEWIWREIADYKNLIMCFDRLATLYDEMGLSQFASGVRKEQKTIREHPENSGRYMVFEPPGDQPKEED